MGSQDPGSSWRWTHTARFPIFVEMRRSILLVATVLSMFGKVQATAASPGCESAPKLSVLCTRNSGLIALSLTNCRKIGNVVIEVRDANGRTLYREEGKAMTPELVRRLDKGTFPKGRHTLTVSARDFAVSETFTVE